LDCLCDGAAWRSHPPSPGRTRTETEAPARRGAADGRRSAADAPQRQGAAGKAGVELEIKTLNPKQCKASNPMTQHRVCGFGSFESWVQLVWDFELRISNLTRLCGQYPGDVGKLRVHFPRAKEGPPCFVATRSPTTNGNASRIFCPA